MSAAERTHHECCRVGVMAVASGTCITTKLPFGVIVEGRPLLALLRLDDRSGRDEPDLEEVPLGVVGDLLYVHYCRTMIEMTTAAIVP
jgi:hypothetical protein